MADIFWVVSHTPVEVAQLVAGPGTEVQCIKKLRGQFNWGPRLNEGPCKNKCEDARGLSGSSGVVNFIYICHR